MKGNVLYKRAFNVFTLTYKVGVDATHKSIVIIGLTGTYINVASKLKDSPPFQLHSAEAFIIRLDAVAA